MAEARGGPFFFVGIPWEPGHECELGERQRFETLLHSIKAAQALAALPDTVPGIAKERREQIRADFKSRAAEASGELSKRLEDLEPNLDRILSMH